MLDARHDVIVTMVANYQWPIIRPYIHSIVQSGFRGRKLVFVHDVPSLARINMQKLGFELIEFMPEGEITIQRYALLRDWLDEQTRQGRDVRYVFALDCRDLVVQTDPSMWMDNNPARLIGASESIYIGNQFTNNEWVESLYGAAGCNLLAQEEVLCAGTLIGEASAIRDVCDDIFQACQHVNLFGRDQAAMNYLYRTKYRGQVDIPSYAQAFVFSGSWFLGILDLRGLPSGLNTKDDLLFDDDPEIRDGIVYPAHSTTPFSIVHQYDRSWDWGEAVRAKYQTV